MIRTIIIDDEQPARDLIKAYLVPHKDVEVIAECSNGFEGFKAIQEHQPDLIFLDVQMPKITGFEMLELIDHPPYVIFSTAFDQYAISAFEKNAIDYLLKPYTRQRLNAALDKVKSSILSVENETVEPHNPTQSIAIEETIHRLVVKNGPHIKVISTSNIHYIKASDDYMEIHTEEGRFLKQITMKRLEAQLPKDQFVRAHRSYIVAISEINKLEQLDKESYQLQLQNHTPIPVSKSGYQKLKTQLQF